jgi:type I restriction enzyme R subunit/putative DNA methylase
MQEEVGQVGQAVSPAQSKEFYRRHLPHWHPAETFLFLTWRLFGSLPRQAEPSPSQETAGRSFLKLDREIDRAVWGPTWLRDRRIASLVVQTLVAGETERKFYQLRAYAVMPNHMHVVLLPKVALPAITRWLKGSTARRANQTLARTGQRFWQDESYDHWIRTQSELERIVRYVERNPVSAGLVSCEAEWPWSSAAKAGAAPLGETACPTV